MMIRRFIGTSELTPISWTQFMGVILCVTI